MNQPTFSAPAHYKQFLRDISAPGPACALYQGASPEDLEYMKTILGANEPIFRSKYSEVMTFIQRTFPIFTGFLYGSRDGDNVPLVVGNLLVDVIRVGLNAFNAPGERLYSPADADELIEGTHCFPSLPKLHR